MSDEVNTETRTIKMSSKDVMKAFRKKDVIALVETFGSSDDWNGDRLNLLKKAEVAKFIDNREANARDIIKFFHG